MSEETIQDRLALGAVRVAQLEARLRLQRDTLRNEALAARAEGLTLREIAEAIGVSKEAVRKMTAQP